MRANVIRPVELGGSVRARSQRNLLQERECLNLLKDESDESAIFLDLDGTLTTIVDDPQRVRLTEETREYLEALSQRFRAVVIISGRAASTLVRIVGLPSLTYVGNHGLEVIADGQRRILLPDPVAKRMRELEDELRSVMVHQGVFLELKELSHAIHYRQARDPEEARKRVLGTLGKMDLRGVRLTEGKLLVQLRPDYPLDKGRALELLVRERGIRRLLYAGDNTTDLDAFRSVTELRTAGVVRGIKVAVIHPDTPSRLIQEADYQVAGVDEMREVLRELAS